MRGSFLSLEQIGLSFLGRLHFTLFPMIRDDLADGRLLDPMGLA